MSKKEMWQYWWIAAIAGSLLVALPEQYPGYEVFQCLLGAIVLGGGFPIIREAIRRFFEPDIWW